MPRVVSEISLARFWNRVHGVISKGIHGAIVEGTHTMFLERNLRHIYGENPWRIFERISREICKGMSLRISEEEVLKLWIKFWRSLWSIFQRNTRRKFLKVHILNFWFSTETAESESIENFLKGISGVPEGNFLTNFWWFVFKEPIEEFLRICGVILKKKNGQPCMGCD